jgi:GT2 family glycosyltransferase
MKSIIYTLIPVLNRLPQTKKVIQSLRAQTIFSNICIVIIDDGSTDGTAKFLASQKDVIRIPGNGRLWWAGAIELGLSMLLKRANENDYVLFLNNDTWFDPDFVETLVKISRDYEGSAVGSVIFEGETEPRVGSIGPKVDIDRLLIWDQLSDMSDIEKSALKSVYEIDALSGRGTLYPVTLFQKHGTMRPMLLRHYLADYEIAMRFARKEGIKLLVSTNAIIYSEPVYGSAETGFNFIERLFSTKSPSNIIRKIVFFMLVGTPMQRITAPLRIISFVVSRLQKKIWRAIPRKNNG